MVADRSSRRRTADSLEEGLDRLVSAGRQLVDGVSGARPGSRRRPAAQPLPRLGELGRWVEERLDGFLDADDDAWREPWQEPRQGEPMRPAGRRPLEAISRRRSPRNRPQAEPSPDGGDDDWPDDASFSLPRWQRDPLRRQPEPSQLPPAAGARRLPRSSRRRPD